MGLLLQRMRQLFSRPAFKRGAAMLVDAAIVIESFAVALLFRFAGNVAPEFWSTFWPFAIFAALAFLLLLYQGGATRSGVTQSPLRYSGIYQDVQKRGALGVPGGLLGGGGATAIAAGGTLHRGLRGGRDSEPQAGPALDHSLWGF